MSAKSVYFTNDSVLEQPTSKFFAKMEKREFYVLIKHYFFRWKTLSETKAKLE